MITPEPKPHRTPFGIGIPSPRILAPMAELSHVAFRKLIRQWGGTDLFFTEMMSAGFLVNKGTGASVFFIHDADEHDLIWQLTGSKPDFLTTATQMLMDHGAQRIDLNMGCSAPLMVQKGEGAAFLRAPERAAMAVRAVRRVFNGHLSVKLRRMWDGDDDRLVAFGRMLESEGVETITLHPRQPTEKFKRQARWASIGHLRSSLTIPVVANGDVRSIADAQRLLREAGPGGIMIGRGTVTRPQIFSEIASGQTQPVKARTVLEMFITLLSQWLPETVHVTRLRLFMAYFQAGVPFGHTLATRLRSAPSLDVARQIISDFFDPVSDTSSESGPGQSSCDRAISTAS